MDSTHPGPAGERPDPRTAFAELSKIMLGAQPLSQIIARVAELAQQTIPGAVDVSVTLLQQEQVSTVAFSGALAAYLDERQYDAGFGPCMDAALSGTVISIPDTAHSPTYPDFGRVAARHGITHTMSIGLPIPERTVGGLNIYGTDDHPFDEATQEVATAFAGYAAVAVANASVYASTASLAANLQRALESRAVIDQAKGILIGQHHISPDEAFDLLCRQSQTSNRKIRDIARDTVERAQRDTEA
jgi:GAF domain-containing protein